MKPAISYYGGKQRIAPRIVDQIYKIPHGVYAEPFAGGLAVLFAKGKPPVKTQSYREVINDRSELLINMYLVAREQPAEFERWISLTLYSQREHRRAIAMLKQPSQHSALELAWAYFVAVSQCFSNCVGSGWKTGVSSNNQAETWASRQSRLPEAMERLKAVHVGCEDAIRFIQRWDSPQTLFYCDPPYPAANQGHYSGYSLADWAALCECLDSIKGSYILSNYAQPVEPKSAQRKLALPANMSAAKIDRNHEQKMHLVGNDRTEILWICDRSNKIRSDIRLKIDPVVQFFAAS